MTDQSGRGPVEDASQAAVRVLKRNRRYGLTVPHITVFPAGYLWDTCVSARGIATVDPARAAADIERYLHSQWRTGLLPNEVYYRRIPSRELLFGRHRDAPRGLTTSGITQPPLIVRAVLDVGAHLDADERARFNREVVPKLVAWARWVIDERIGRHGLAVVIHPWETGMDNRLDLATVMATEWLDRPGLLARIVRGAGVAGTWVVRHVGGDLRRIPVTERSSNPDVWAATRQLLHIRRYGYDMRRIEASGRGVLVEDVGFNAVLVDAFEGLAELVTQPGTEALQPLLAAELPGATQRLRTGLNELWDEADHPGYYARNYRTGQLMTQPSVAGLYPLLTEQDSARKATMLAALQDPRQFATPLIPPAAPADSPGFAPDRYWQGAAWPFPLDIIETALTQRGHHEIAAQLRTTYLTRPHAAAHAEYQNPLTGRPLGAQGFSPSAGLYLRLRAASRASQ